jgi:hypothetical protein
MKSSGLAKIRKTLYDKSNDFLPPIMADVTI